MIADEVQAIGSFRKVWLWHLDVDENFVTFEIDWEKHPPEVQQTKWELTGRCLSRKHFPLSLPDGIKCEPCSSTSQRTFGIKTVTRIESQVNDDVMMMTMMMMMDLIYDHAIDKLSIQWANYALPRRTNYFTREYSRHLTPYISYCWNHAFNGIDILNTATSTRIMLPTQLDIREVFTTRELLDKPVGDPDSEPSPRIWLVGDREALWLAWTASSFGSSIRTSSRIFRMQRPSLRWSEVIVFTLKTNPYLIQWHFLNVHSCSSS
ncbi:hypothetical protein VTN49DRAFT_2462 [Thermomyces lanuginosus]|uniref:uncharacterized protein n=1 Tax=Thermomyces lanuginosus TaxID=5541 RepID=UPI003743BF37